MSYRAVTVVSHLNNNTATVKYVGLEEHFKKINKILKVKTQNPAMEMSLVVKKKTIKTFQGSPAQCTLYVRTAK